MRKWLVTWLACYVVGGLTVVAAGEDPWSNIKLKGFHHTAQIIN
jgi:hypothetical protein